MANILLVEDDEFIGRMINMRLTIRKHVVEQAFNGQQAIDKVPAGDYDLVLMDMHMPVMDGHQATRQLREMGYRGLIIAVTASVMSADSQKAIKSGCDNYISKPIGADFEERIDAMLENPQIDS